jgi:uncharacterized Zn finger protein
MSGYWGYYRSERPKAVENGIKAKSKRGAIGERWWSKRWVSLLESFNIGARLGRGRTYARKGQVISINIQKGFVKAEVQGVQSEPYKIEIKLKLISDDDWEKVIDVMASKAIFAAKLLSGEMPTEIEDAFAEADVSLFPTKKDLKTNCSCPDWSNPCKHIAAVYYLLAERFDEDPFLIFKLRGRTKEEVIGALRKRRVSAVEPEEVPQDLAFASEAEDAAALEKCLDNFWDLGEGLDEVHPVPRSPKISNAVLKRLGGAPVFIGKTNLAACLPKAYEVAGRAALQKVAEYRAIGPDDETAYKRPPQRTRR